MNEPGSPFLKQAVTLLVFTFFALTGVCEGTKQVLPDSTVSSAGLYIYHDGYSYPNFAVINCLPNYRLNIHVRNVGETILFGMKSISSGISFNLRKPDGTIAMTGICPSTPAMTGYIRYYKQALVGPFPQAGGYTPFSFKVTNVADTGDYYFEINMPLGSQITLDYWDFQVVSGQNSPPVPGDMINGRVWSKSWQMWASLSYDPFNARFYVYSDDGIVTKLAFSDAHVGAVTIFCNPYGCLNTGNFVTDRQSSNENTYMTFPGIAQYKVFLNDPDQSVYPSGVYGEIIGTPVLETDPSFPPCSGNKLLGVTVDKAGKLEIIITFPYGGSSTTVSMYADVLPGGNHVPWDGKDGLGDFPPDGTVINVTVNYLNGLTNLPVWDQEGNPDGYVISLIRPPNPANPVPATYWDDSQLTFDFSCYYPPQGTNLAGCTPGSIPGTPGCHPWNQNLPDCHDKMINTWWYSNINSVSFDTSYSGFPAQPAGHNGSRCGTGTVILHATVPVTQTVDWYASPSGGTPLLSGDTTFVTPVISTTTIFFAEARKLTTGCISNSRSPVIAEVLPAPVPVISGPDEACTGSSDNFYSTEPGMLDYHWTISSGGEITSGNGTNIISVIWNMIGQQSVSVSYAPFSGCISDTTIYIVTVDPLPVPVISGPAAVCADSSFVVYSTQPGMTGYLWTISDGGEIIYGSGTDEITVSWNLQGAQHVAVIYSDTNGCTALNPTIFPVLVYPVALPEIMGPDEACSGSEGNIYSTTMGMSGYNWSVSAGGTITGGYGTSEVHVEWDSTGLQWLSVFYSDTNGCTSLPAIFRVTVIPLPVPVITGPGSACSGSTGNLYATESGMQDYLWTISPEGIISGGTGSDKISVTWQIPGNGWVSVNYTDTAGCRAVSPSILPVVVSPLPGAAGEIRGLKEICIGSGETSYEIDPVLEAITYTWSFPPGTTILSGQGSSSVVVSFDSIAVSGNIAVFASNGCGDGPVSPPFALQVHRKSFSYAGNDLSTCDNTPVMLATSEASDYLSLRWESSGDGIFSDPAILHPDYTPGIQDIQTQVVILTLVTESVSPCANDSGSATLHISKQAIVNAGQDKSTCGNAGLFLLDASATGYSDLNWITTGTGTFSDPDEVNTLYYPGDQDLLTGTVRLVLTATSFYPCQPVADTLLIDISKSPSVNPGPDGSICVNTPFTVSAASAQNYSSINWTHNGTGVITGENSLTPTYSPAPGEAGIIIMTLDAAGIDACLDSNARGSMKLTIFEPPVADAGEDQNISMGTSVILDGNAHGGSGSYSFNWQPSGLFPDNSVPRPETVGITQDTTVYLEVTDLVSGCSGTDSARIIVSKPGTEGEECIEVHNVITPNGDGVNDSWIIDCIEHFPDNHVILFDRWGDKVVEFENYNNTSVQWDGKNQRNEMVPDGTYYYVLTIRNGSTKSGWVMVRGGSR